MKTLILDIDGTITDIWPIGRSVLLRMLGQEYKRDVGVLRSGGITDTWKIFNKISKKRLGKRDYWKSYDLAFGFLLQATLLPTPARYPICDWISRQALNYRFLYATGGRREETLYTLKQLGLLDVFDVENSIDKSNCRFSKKTGIPFRRISSMFKDCMLITDSQADCDGAELAGIDFLKVKPRQEVHCLI